MPSSGEHGLVIYVCLGVHRCTSRGETVPVVEGADFRALPELWPPMRKVLQEGSGGWARREREVKAVLGLILAPKR